MRGQISKTRQLALCFLLFTAVLAPAARAVDEVMVMGVFPRRNAAETTKMFAPLAQHLAEKLGHKVKLVTAKNFESFWQGVIEQRYDVVHYNQYHYIRSSGSYQVISHIEEFGRSTIAGVVYVRKDSGITTLRQLQGRKILFGGGEDAMISYITNRYLLLQAGLKKEDFVSLFAVNPPNSILALHRRQADAAGAGDRVLDLPVIRKAVDAEEFLALSYSQPLLQLPIAVKRSMPPERREAIKTTLVNLKKSDAGMQVLKSAALTGMGPAEDKDYDPHRKIVREVLGPDAVAP